jgi:hypothetical protein
MSAARVRRQRAPDIGARSGAGSVGGGAGGGAGGARSGAGDAGKAGSGCTSARRIL